MSSFPMPPWQVLDHRTASKGLPYPPFPDPPPRVTNWDRYQDHVWLAHRNLTQEYQLILTDDGYLATINIQPRYPRPEPMASSEVDMKFLGQFAENIQLDHPLLAKNLFQILGNLSMLSDKVIKARKLRRLDTTRVTKSVDLYCCIIWYAREGLKLLEEYVLPMVANFGELKVLSYKLRASFYHLYVLFHNQPSITRKAGEITTPPGLKSPRSGRVDKGKAPERESPADPFRPSSVQPTHPLEGGPVGGHAVPHPPPEFAPNFLVPAEDYRPFALHCFQEATGLAERLLWGSHPLRLSVKVEYAAFLYDCLHEKDRSRQLAKATIAEVYNAQEGMDDDMFEDAAELVGILGRMMRRGLGSGNSGSTPGFGSVATPPPKITPPKSKRAGRSTP
ncbi:hypothetical protein B7494_g3382 [Chlorociboria aeruginascens]|nr:hypothetical protein B7494_g3382 [Chlorociboria aeruginascens]